MMKKYISISSLLTVFLIHSCDRSIDRLTNETQQIPRAKEMKDTGEVSATAKNESSSTGTAVNADNMDTGDDDEPRRDKQHWKVRNDTVK